MIKGMPFPSYSMNLKAPYPTQMLTPFTGCNREHGGCWDEAKVQGGKRWY